ncbi:MAG: nicotinate-nucleotide diphosphorylase (carboxylating) [Nitrospirae bacterium GWB2_47_37]|nr:MAG: nicotinate-nucleotide diphosphorylase (carboxylating) [Nitrospirae bacterium GWA2_46_11]OGW24153.1 MAG: nicotinate-nucleotide diphosphorylase (carboxylating) [Nitrospirae bacterium GWB2_47_37]
MTNELLKETIRLAMLEDIGHGDITSLLTVPEDSEAKARITAKEDFVLAGMPFVKEVFDAIDTSVAVRVSVQEGAAVKKGEVIAEISGNARSLLAGERISLNILQRISGIATMTRAYVEKVSGLPVKIADTRKTTPGMRFMEKYGVKIGGGVNHRFGLYDGILIKDNHIKIAGGVGKAVGLTKNARHLLKIEVEVKNFDELREALNAGADVIMLDNMSVDEMKEAVTIAKGRAVIEASGNVNLENIRGIAETGTDIISIGALTHSARAVDISMKII